MPRIHGEAQAEIRSAAMWYEERVPGLGDKLVVEVGIVFDRIDALPRVGTPWKHATLTREVRRTSVRTFPYQVFYVLAPDPHVLAFSHSSRERGYRLARLDDLK